MYKYPYNGIADAKEVYDGFDTKISEFVKLHLKGYKPSGYAKNKVIHDPVWGTTLFYKWELKILDSPLLQRLRNISQLGLTMLTYPSAHHTRFEHTLGVMSVVTKMVHHINQDAEGQMISDEDFYTLRLAALLHDIGHCFCSHLSESIYGKLIEFAKLKKSYDIFKTAKAHEIFAYIIINTDEFQNFIKEEVVLWKPDLKYDKLFFEIGHIIVGANLPPERRGQELYEQKYYLTQIINGQYDADKLDYLRRDSYTAGLALTYDIDRFLYKIKIAEKHEITDDGKTVIGKHLAIPVTGISAVEEMAFSQLMLASYIYQHQKVLATDALIHDVVEGLTSNEKLSHPCDYLNYCDDDILGIYSENPDNDFKSKIANENFNSLTNKKMEDIVKRIKNRDLPKRAFAVNYSTIAKEYKKNYVVSDIADRLKKICKLREEICEVAKEISNSLPVKGHGGKKPIDIYDIHISIPKISIAKDLSNALVINNNDEFVSLSEIIRLSDWADAFAWHKWNAYVFSKVEVLPFVSIASKIVFERYNISFNEDTVFSNIKCADEIKEIIRYLKEHKKYPT